MGRDLPPQILHHDHQRIVHRLACYEFPFDRLGPPWFTTSDKPDANSQ